MNIRNILLTAVFSLLSISLSAQAVSQDSINVLKARKDQIQIREKLNEKRLELAKLENQVQEKTQKMNSAAEEAQRSADENKRAAEYLGDNPQDRKLARRARKAARRAHKDAKCARKAADRLDDLQKDIEALRKEITEYESKTTPL